MALVFFSTTLAWSVSGSVEPDSAREPDLLERLLAAETLCNAPCPPADATVAARVEIETLVVRARSVVAAADQAASPAGARARVAALNRFIFEELAIKPSRDLTDPDNLLIGRVVSRKQGYCVGIASLYMVLAEKLGLPVRAVATPSHLFLRYDDGATRINIETFQEGAPIPDEQYAREEKIPPETIRRGIFLRSLSEEEFLAQVHNNLGVIESARKEYAGAATRYKEALRLYPRFPAALYNYGTDLLHEGHANEAAKLFSKSLRLYPADPWALNNRGLAYQRLGNFGKSTRDFEAALKLDPGFEQARKNLESLSTAKSLR